MSHRLKVLLVAGCMGASLLGASVCNPLDAHAQTTAVTIHAIEVDEHEAGSYDKTGGIRLTPIIASMGAASVGCLTLAHRLREDDDDDEGDVSDAKA